MLVDEIKALVPESNKYDIAFFPELLEVTVYTDDDEVNFKIRAIEVEKA